MRSQIATLVICLINTLGTFAQIDYTNLSNWVFHPNKTGSLIDGYNLNIGVVDHNLNTTQTISIPNHSMTNTGIDVFFVHPTILTSLPGTAERRNVPILEQPEALINSSVLGQAGLLAKYGRFFAPRYRQGTPATYIGSPLDSTQAIVIANAYNDVKDAFLNYLESHNNGNKIIIASHSQGAYLASMLLADVFDNNIELRDNLITAVVAGVVSSYAQSGEVVGGWWKNIPQCTTITQCGCVMTWRSYKEGQNLPSPSNSLPQLNPILRDWGYVHRLLNLNNDWILQDSLFYANSPQPLRYYLSPKTNQPYGGNVGFIAFDSLYQIRFLRDAPRRLGFMVTHTPKPNDLRPNILQEEENNILFNVLGYHNRDYSIYNWALMQQIDQKILNCNNNSGILESIIEPSINIYPNPTSHFLNIDSEYQIEEISIINNLGQVIISQKNNKKSNAQIAVSDLARGIYFLRIRLQSQKSKVFKIIIE